MKARLSDRLVCTHRQSVVAADQGFRSMAVLEQLCNGRISMFGLPQLAVDDRGGLRPSCSHGFDDAGHTLTPCEYAFGLSLRLRRATDDIDRIPMAGMNEQVGGGATSVDFVGDHSRHVPGALSQAIEQYDPPA